MIEGRIEQHIQYATVLADGGAAPVVVASFGGNAKTRVNNFCAALNIAAGHPVSDELESMIAEHFGVGYTIYRNGLSNEGTHFGVLA